MARLMRPRSAFARWPVVFACAFAACLGLLSTGCKTQQDAEAAAAQMSATANCLSDYYSALGAILAQTDQLYSLNEAIFSKPYTQANRDLMKNNQDEIAHRAQLAADFSTLAANFGKLTGSTAPADVSASALKLQTQIDSLASRKESAGEQNLLKAALSTLVSAIQQGKEREAARAIDDAAAALAKLFEKETPASNSIHAVYTQIAANAAQGLVDKGVVDETPLLKTALDPFGLALSEQARTLNKDLAPAAARQIAQRRQTLDNSYSRATADMQKSLDEMARRIHLVALDRPMDFRAPPITVENVEKWAALVASF